MQDVFLPGNGFDTYEAQDKVLVGMSGGVDSSVAVRILQQQGFAVTGAVIRFSPAHEGAVEAARRWGVADEWGHIAGYCTVRRGGKAARPRCSRCGKEFGRPGQAAGKCPDCLRADELHRRQMAELPRADRRAGMRG